MNAPDDTMIGGKRREICALMTVQRARFPGARALRAPLRAPSLVPPAGDRQPDRNRPALARKGGSIWGIPDYPDIRLNA
jgi:hypothetical protein